jgi:transposase
MAQQTAFVGIDVSKAWLDLSIWPTGDTFRLGNDREGRAELVKRLRRVAAEAIGLEASGGYERHALNALLDAGLPARRVNPLRVRQFAKACGILAKNDRIDASVIARFIATVQQRPIERDRAAEALAELVTARRQLCEELTRASNQAGHADHIMLKRLAQKRANRLKADILLLDKTIAQAVAANAEMARKNELMRSVPCVGPVLAHSLLALMPELGKLSNRQAASLLGVAPFDCDSGDFRGQRHIFGGRRNLRDVAYMAALVGSKTNPVFHAFRQRLQTAGKKPKVIIVAIMRKLIVTINAMIRDGKTWQPT